MSSISIPWRYIIVGIMFVSTLSITAMRYCFSLTLTQMVKMPAKNVSAAKDPFTCPNQNGYSARYADIASKEYTLTNEKYDWSNELQGMILSSFYLGYSISHFPGGLIADRIGGKMVFATALVSTVIFTLLIPMAVHFGGASALIGIRLAMGLFQGGIFPAINTILSAWIPRNERSRMVSLVFCGYPLGSTIGNFFSGILLQYYTSWDMVFYHFAVIGIITSILFIIFCSSNPLEHPFITSEEKEYLRNEMNQVNLNKHLSATPWKSIISSKPIIALTLTSFLGDWTYYVLLIDLPKYLNDVLHISVKENGFYTSLPWSMYVIVSLCTSYWSDWLISNSRLSITETRKLFVIVSSLLDAFFVIAAAYGGCDPVIVGIFFAISVGATGLQTSGFLANAMDLSPNYSGTISGLSSSFGAFSGVLGPALVGFLTPNSLQSEWHIVFWINFFMHMVKIVIFTVWGSAKIQKWNQPHDQEIKLEENNQH